jgi:hypothetical protein
MHEVDTEIKIFCPLVAAFGAFEQGDERLLADVGCRRATYAAKRKIYSNFRKESKEKPLIFFASEDYSGMDNTLISNGRRK